MMRFFLQQTIAAVVVIFLVSCHDTLPPPRFVPPNNLDVDSIDEFDVDRMKPSAQNSWYCFYHMPAKERKDEYSVCQRSKEKCEHVGKLLDGEKTSCVLTVMATKPIYSFTLFLSNGKRDFGFFSTKSCGWWLEVFDDPEYRKKNRISEVKNHCFKPGVP